jgi:hypothetical protein
MCQNGVRLSAAEIASKLRRICGKTSVRTGQMLDPHGEEVRSTVSNHEARYTGGRIE